MRLNSDTSLGEIFYTLVKQDSLTLLFPYFGYMLRIYDTLQLQHSYLPHILAYFRIDGSIGRKNIASTFAHSP